MIAVTVEKDHGPATVRWRVRAASIERALRLAGEGARLVFPIDARLFFAPRDSQEGVEELPRGGTGGVVSA